MLTIVKRGEKKDMMRQWMWSVIPVLLAGCVSSGEYERVRTQYEHLKGVKTEWEIEKDDLGQRVDAVQRAYSNVSKDQGALHLQQEQGKMEVARVRDDARVLNGKVAAQDSRISALDQKFDKVVEQLSTLAESNVLLGKRIESLIGKLDTLSARIRPTGSIESKSKSSEMKKAPTAQSGAHRAEDGPRASTSKMQESAGAAFNDAGEKPADGLKPASPAVEEAMRQREGKARAPVVGNEVGKAADTVKNPQAQPAPPSEALTFSPPAPAGSGVKPKVSDGTPK